MTCRLGTNWDCFCWKISVGRWRPGWPLKCLPPLSSPRPLVTLFYEDSNCCKQKQFGGTLKSWRLSGLNLRISIILIISLMNNDRLKMILNILTAAPVNALEESVNSVSTRSLSQTQLQFKDTNIINQKSHKCHPWNHNLNFFNSSTFDNFWSASYSHLEY